MRSGRVLGSPRLLGFLPMLDGVPLRAAFPFPNTIGDASYFVVSSHCSLPLVHSRTRMRDNPIAGSPRRSMAPAISTAGGMHEIAGSERTSSNPHSRGREAAPIAFVLALGKGPVRNPVPSLRVSATPHSAHRLLHERGDPGLLWRVHHLQCVDRRPHGPLI